jgi:RNA polymerase sigma factor (sigma-70 family)
MSDVFERASAKAEAVPDEVFETRLFAAARKVVIGHYRQHRRSGRQTQQEPQSLVGIGGVREDHIPESDEVTKMMDHVRRLPQREQDVLALKFMAELSNSQIGEVMGSSETSVRATLRRTLTRLRGGPEVES